jgi:hypothetical protein
VIKIKNIIILIALFLALSACDGKDTTCWGSSNDSYSDTSTIETAYNNYAQALSNSEGPDGTLGIWVASGLILSEGEQVVPYISQPNEITIANGYSSTSLNDQLLTEYVIPASLDTPTAIVDVYGNAVNFSLNQQITITTPTCTTGADSYGTASPTKWTWSNNWLYKGVNCSYVEDGCAFTEVCPTYPTAPNCIASADCTYDCVSWGALGTSCLSADVIWYCNHKDISYTTPPYISGQPDYNTYDVCPTDPGSNGTPPTTLTDYICEGPAI